MKRPVITTLSLLALAGCSLSPDEEIDGALAYVGEEVALASTPAAMPTCEAVLGAVGPRPTDVAGVAVLMDAHGTVLCVDSTREIAESHPAFLRDGWEFDAEIGEVRRLEEGKVDPSSRSFALTADPGLEAADPSPEPGIDPSDPRAADPSPEPGIDPSDPRAADPSPEPGTRPEGTQGTHCADPSPEPGVVASGTRAADPSPEPGSQPDELGPSEASQAQLTFLGLLQQQ